MSRFSNLLKNFAAPPPEEIQKPSFIKPKNDSSDKESDSSAKPDNPPAPSGFTPKTTKVSNPVDVEQLSFKPAPVKQADIKYVTVPVYKSDTEWDVVQRSVGALADEWRLSGDSKQAFVQKWVGVMERLQHTSLHRDSFENPDEHIGNHIDTTKANPTTGLLGTYQAAIHPDKLSGMMYDLQALQQMERVAAGISDQNLVKEFKADLRAIILGSMQEQTLAAQKLLRKVQAGQPGAEKIYAATKTLANCNEMRLNATLKSAVLKMDVNKFQQLGIQSAVEEPVEMKISPKTPAQVQWVEDGDKNEPVKEKGKSKKLSDSAWVDKQAAKLLGNLKV